MIKRLLSTCVVCLLGAGQLQAQTPVARTDDRIIAARDLVAGVESYLDPTNNATWEALSQLAPAEWTVLKFMLCAAPEELDAFISEYSDSDLIYVLPDGSFSADEPDGNSLDGPYTKASLRDIVNQIRSVVSTINSRAANIQGRLPANTPAIRDLFQQLSPTTLRDLLVLVQETLGPTLDLVAAQREGFDGFRDAGVFVFRSDLNLMLDNLGGIWATTQQLVCLTRPAYQPVPLEFDRIRNLIDRAPPILLYGLFVALEQVPFDWRLEELASELQVDSFCEVQKASAYDGAVGTIANASISDPTVRQSFEIRRCNFLRNQQFFVARAEVSTAKLAAEALATAAEYSEQAEKAQKDDQVAQASAVALGGGGAGTNFKNPLKVAAALVTFVTSQASKVLDRALAIKKSCEDADAQREADLLACRAQVRYVLSGDDIVFIDELVERRIGEVEADSLDPQGADMALDMARSELDSRQAFVCMCDAYQRLVLPMDQLPRVKCLEDPFGPVTPRQP